MIMQKPSGVHVKSEIPSSGGSALDNGEKEVAVPADTGRALSWAVAVRDEGTPRTVAIDISATKVRPRLSPNR